MLERSMLVGWVLLLVVPLMVWDGVSSLRAGFGNAFWALPLEDKLPRIAAEPAAWRRLGTAWIYFVGVLAAGFIAFALQLGAAGEPVLAALGLGLFLVSAIAFVVVLVIAILAVAVAAGEGTVVPSWLEPIWDSSWVMERVFVVGANLAYAVWGAAMLSTDFPADWAGWVALVSGILIAAWASLRDYFFQHMVLVTPIVVGIALVVA